MQLLRDTRMPSLTILHVTVILANSHHDYLLLPHSPFSLPPSSPHILHTQSLLLPPSSSLHPLPSILPPSFSLHPPPSLLPFFPHPFSPPSSKVFHLFDPEGKGYVTRKEIAQFCDRRNSTLDHVMASLDTDHDGQISFEEFQAGFQVSIVVWEETNLIPRT